MGIMPTETELTLEQTQQVTMEILLEPTSNKLLVGDMGDSIWIELVTLDINLVTHRLIIKSSFRSIDEIVNYWFTNIVLCLLETLRFENGWFGFLLNPGGYPVISKHLSTGKDNGVNIVKSIDEGPFQMGTFQETLTEGNEGALHLGPKRPQVYSDLSPEEKKRVDRIEIRGTMHEVHVSLVIGELRTELGMQIHVKKGRLSVTIEPENRVELDEEQLLYIADFVIGQLNDQVQSKGNTIHQLREKISRLTKKHSDADPIYDLNALDSYNKELHAKVNAFHDLNERWRAKNEKVKRHYRKFYDSIKIMCAQTIEKTNSLLTKVANLKAQIKENRKSNYVTMPAVKSKVLAPGMYVIDVEPTPPRNRSNMDVYLDYLKNLKESVATLREIVEEDRVKKPLDCSLASACRYTKHS
nr:integrase, catalytic region, zinc finger, CCHC-type, peptidase aspartic, catalytic [Tanacetum cinerariifolium]